MKKKPGRKIKAKPSADIVDVDRWLFEVKMIISPMKTMIDEDHEAAMTDLWDLLFAAMENESIAVLDIDINQLIIIRKENEDG
jgi:hypothetical protein